MNLLLIDFEALPTSPIGQWYQDHDCYLITSATALAAMTTSTIDSFKLIISITIANPDNDDLIYYCAEKLRQTINFDYVIGVREFDLLPAAYLREKWQLPGASVNAIQAYRDKGLMKHYLQTQHIAVPNFTIINTALDVINFIAENGYPVIIKPRRGRRAQGISLLYNDNDLYQLLSTGLKPTCTDLINLMVEEFVDAPMYHVDGVVIDGTIKFIWPSLYLTKCSEFQNGNDISSCLLSPHDPLLAKLNDYVHSCINALPSPGSFAFHAEVFAGADGSLKLCEIAARAGGGPVMAAIESVFAINPKQIAFKAYIDEKPTSIFDTINLQPTRLCGWIIVPNKLAHAYVDHLPSHCPFPQVSNYTIFAQNGDFFAEQRQVIAEICLAAATPVEIKKAISEIMAWFDDQVRWYH